MRAGCIYRDMFKPAKLAPHPVTAVLTRSDLEVVDELAAKAGVTREEALLQLLRFQLLKQRWTVH